VPMGVVKGYTGSIVLNLIINSTGVEVTGPSGFTGKKRFSEDLQGFSLDALRRVNRMRRAAWRASPRLRWSRPSPRPCPNLEALEFLGHSCKVFGCRPFLLSCGESRSHEVHSTASGRKSVWRSVARSGGRDVASFLGVRN
jgi:hypothetical protein